MMFVNSEYIHFLDGNRRIASVMMNASCLQGIVENYYPDCLSLRLYGALKETETVNAFADPLLPLTYLSVRTRTIYYNGFGIFRELIFLRKWVAYLHASFET